MKQTASWNLPTFIQNIMLNHCLKQSITDPHLEPKKCSQHIAKVIKSIFQYYPSINGYVFHKLSSLQITVQI